MQQGKITYHQQVSYCGKPRCRKCREGIGHGPYWYAYQTVEGRTTRTYIGKHLPPENRAEMEGVQNSAASPQTHEHDNALIKIYTLGQFRLERRSSRDHSWETVTESGWQHQRVRSLLTSLVSGTGRKLGREQIMDSIWPDLEIDAASGRLDRAVYSLRQLFEPARSRLATSPLLLTEREMLILGEHPLIWIDADAFEKLLVRAHESSDPGEKERFLEDAMMLYGGDFLPEERKLELTLSRRDSLRRSWTGMLLDLSDLRSARDALTSAIEPLDRLLSIDPANEAAVQRLISLLGQQGRRAEAIRTYRNLAKVLQQEYRIAPLPETRALYEAISKGLDRRLVRPTTTGESNDRPSTSERSGQSTPLIQIGRAHQSPLVGREQEVSKLNGLLSGTEQATRFKLPSQKRSFGASLDLQRQSQCVLLMGDVGIGKTRLAEEASREAQRRKWTVAWSRVYAQESTIPYRLWTEILRKSMEQGAWQRQKLSERPVTFQPLSALLPDLNLPPGNAPASLSPEQEQLRLWEAARELLCVISEGSPLLIALDDLQWADNSSCELLAYLARYLRGHPIVIVATCRDNELPGNHILRSLITDLQRENAVETLNLPPLKEQEIDAIIANVPTLPHALAEHIRKRADGNPFFAEELARTLGSDDESEISNGRQPDPASLPDTISAVLDLRLSRLSEPCRLLLRKAAVLGSSFTFDLISAMEALTPGSNEDMVLEQLEEALRSGMLNEEGTGTRITYNFWHPLLVSHLYEALSAARRASLHRRASEALISLYSDRTQEHATSIVHHLVQAGGDPRQIVHYAEIAGNRAYALSSYPEAEKLYRIALEHANLFTPTTVQGRLNEEQQRVARLLELLGECNWFQGQYEQACHFYEQALDLHKQQQILRSSDEGLKEIQIQALLWCEIGVTWYYRGNFEQARQCYQHGEQELQDAGIVGGPAWAYIRSIQSHVSGKEGSYEDARRIAEEALELFSNSAASQDQLTTVQTHSTLISRILAGDKINLAGTHTILAAVAAAGGEYEKALEHYTIALTIFEQSDSKREIASISCNLGDVYLRQSEHNLAHAAFRRALNIAQQIGYAPLESFIFGNLGVLDTRFGALSDAEKEFRKSVDLTSKMNDRVHLSVWQAFLANVLQDQGKIDEANITMKNALVIARSTRIVPYIGLVLVALCNMRINKFLTFHLENPRFTSIDPSSIIIAKKARNTLKRVLRLKEIEAETRSEARLYLAQVELIFGEIEAAREIAEQTLDEAHQHALTWLAARAHRILGNVLFKLEQTQEAIQHFEQSRRTFSKAGMRLEHARTLREYGESLLHNYGGKPNNNGIESYHRGLDYLKESLRSFKDCGAELDCQLTEQLLNHYQQIY